MKMGLKSKLAILGLVGVSALVLAQSAYRLVINGKAYSTQAIVVKGETYVPLKALQAAGIKASTSGGTLSLSIPSSGGAMQMDAVEGGLGEWLFNGIWRFKAFSITKRDGDLASWSVHVELRNATKCDEIALNNTGYESIKLILDTGTQLDIDNPTDIRDSIIAQAGSRTVDLIFTAPEGITGTPEKLLFVMRPNAETAKYMRDVFKVAYGPAGGTLRVNLK